MGWRWALIWVWLGAGGDGRLFEAGRLLTFSTFRMDANSRWALIRGCALIRINKVYKELTKLKSGTLVYLLIINNLLETINLKPVERSSQIFLTLTVVNSLMSRVTWYDPNDLCASCFTLDGTFLLVNNQTLNSIFCGPLAPAKRMQRSTMGYLRIQEILFLTHRPYVHPFMLADVK